MDQENERNISRLWRAFKTVKEMVKDRGYFITQEEVELPLEDFKAKYCDSMGRPQRKTVSYTHLDVYKRQLFLLSGFRLPWPGPGTIINN